MTTINKDGQLDIDLGDKPTIGHRLELLETLIKQLEIRIANLEAAGTVTIPSLDPADENKCSICGVYFENTMGYVCDNMACPMYPRTGDFFTRGHTGG